MGEKLGFTLEVLAVVFVFCLAVGVLLVSLPEPEPKWSDTGFRTTMELIPEPEASEYYDGRKLINDNQRNWIDGLAKEADK